MKQDTFLYQKQVITIVLIIICQITFTSLMAQPLIIDHHCTHLDVIPDAWIDSVKAKIHAAYQHTSHGSQLVTGLDALKNFPDFGTKYEWTDNGSSGLDLDDYGIPGAVDDLSQGDYIDGNGVTPWCTASRNLLDNPANLHINFVMWSWCSINGHDIPRYLEFMDTLVTEYSEGGTKPRAATYPVEFLYMTGHAEGQGEGGFIYNANQLIRQHCIDNNRILFDFADIENYDPDGYYYYDKPMWDNLDYTDVSYRDSNWGIEWVAVNPGTELQQLTTGAGVSGYSGCGSCAHCGSAAAGNTINCVLKGRAIWWMMACLAGWDPPEYNSRNLVVIGSPLSFNGSGYGDGHQVDMTFSAATGIGDAFVAQYDTNLTDIPCANGLGLYWDIIIGDSLTSFTVDITFHYTNTDVSGITESEAFLGISKYDESTNTWIWLGGTVNAASNTVTVSGITDCSKFVLFRRIFGDITGDGYVDAADLQRLGDCWHETNTGEFSAGTDAQFFNTNKNTDAGDQIIDAGDLQVFGDCWHNGIP